MILAPHSFTSNKLKPPGNIENLVSRERNLLHREPLIYTFFDDLDGKSIAGELLEAWETASRRWLENTGSHNERGRGTSYVYHYGKHVKFYNVE